MCLYLKYNVCLYQKYKYHLHKVGKLLRGVTVGHVERPGLVWINAPPTEDSNALLQKVIL